MARGSVHLILILLLLLLYYYVVYIYIYMRKGLEVKGNGKRDGVVAGGEQDVCDNYCLF